MLSEDVRWETFGSRALGLVAYGGAEIGEVRAIVDAVGDGGPDEWHRAWTAGAHRLDTYADDARRAGRLTSARGAYARAAVYHWISYYPLYGAPVDPRVVDASAKAHAAMAEAVSLWPNPVHVVEIPYEDTTLPGYFATVDDSGAPRPTLIHVNGYDSCIQETFFSQAVGTIEHGYNVLVFDGPGQGRNLVRDGLHLRPDWENVVTPVVDWVLEQPEVDPERLVLSGWSLGGFLAPRAACGEHRIAALVADPGQWDMTDNVLAKLPLSDEAKASYPDIDRSLLADTDAFLSDPDGDPMSYWRMVQRALWVHGLDTITDYLLDLARYEISSVIGELRCPTLITRAEGDPLGSAAQTLYDAVPVERKVLVDFTAAEGAGGHCEAFARRLYHARTFDWLDETLGLD